MNCNQLVFLELVRIGLFAGGNVYILNCASVDWGYLYSLAKEQSVVGLVAAGIGTLPTTERLSHEVTLRFVGHTLQLEQRNIAMNGFIAGLTERLRRDSISALLVKGQGIAQCYEKPLWRACGDVDLLLSADNYEKAKKVLLPLASNVEQEYTHFKHQGMTIDGWVVELHGTLHSRLSGRVDRMVDEVQGLVSYGGKVRSWVVPGSRFMVNGESESKGVQVFLPGPDEDVIFVFTHILHHYFFEGIGLRQICDWCRLLWTYKDSLDYGLLEQRLQKAGLVSEWKAFYALASKYLGMPDLGSGLMTHDSRFDKKAEQIMLFVMKVGNFGHNQRGNSSDMPYLKRKFVSFWGRLSDMLRHFWIFPLDSIRFFGGVLRSGLHAAVRGE